EILRDDADREVVDADAASPVEDEIVADFGRREDADALAEVVHVSGRVEAQKVEVEQRVEELPGPGEDGEEIGAGEGDVQEAAQGSPVAAAPQGGGQQEQMVVVGPDRRLRFDELGDRLGERVV